MNFLFVLVIQASYSFIPSKKENRQSNRRKIHSLISINKFPIKCDSFTVWIIHYPCCLFKSNTIKSNSILLVALDLLLMHNLKPAHRMDREMREKTHRSIRINGMHQVNYIYAGPALPCTPIHMLFTSQI